MKKRVEPVDWLPKSSPSTKKMAVLCDSVPQRKISLDSPGYGWGKSKTLVSKYSVESNDFAEPSVRTEDSIWKTVSSEDFILHLTVCEKNADEVCFIGLLKKGHTNINKSVKHKILGMSS